MSYQGSNPKWKTGGFTPQSSIPTSPREGDVYRDDGTNKAKGLYEYKNGAWVALGSSSASGINYVTNGDASQGVTGWATYADAAGVSPVDGTGGSPTVTFTANTSSPLRGTADFVLTKDAANRQGEGASYDFTIDNADFATPMRISFNYKASANFSYTNQDVRVFVYSKDGTALIPVTPAVLDGSGKFVGEFQTEASPNNDYRLIFHVATTNATAYTLNVDQIQCGPSQLMYANLQDRQYALTVSGPTGWATTSAVGIPYKTKDGAWRLRFNIHGTFTSASTGAVTISGVTYKTGIVQAVTATTSTSSYIVYCEADSSAISFSLSANATQIQLSGDLYLNAMPTWATDFYPVQIGDNAETRIVASGAYKTATQTITAGSPAVVVFETKRLDTHAAFNTTTGVFTAPVSGYYRATANVNVIMGATAADNIEARFLKNGTGSSIGTSSLNSLVANKVYTLPPQAIVQLNAGETLSVQVSAVLQNVTIGYTGATNDVSSFYVERVSGPATIAAAEKVAARYLLSSSSSNISIAATSTEIIDFDTKSFDTHAAVTAGASWKFTAPRTGYYRISSSIVLSAVAVSKSLYLFMYKNGSQAGKSFVLTAATADCGITYAGMVQLNAGEYVDIRIYNGDASARNLDTTATSWSIDIDSI